MVLVLPAPDRLLATLTRLAGGAPVGGPHERAGMYVADLLRELATQGIAGLLLDDAEPAPSATPADFGTERYQAIGNVAAHYSWPMYLRLPGQGPGGHLVRDGRPAGLVMPADFCNGAPAPDPGPGGVLLAAVPADADPDLVQGRLAAVGR